MKEVLVLGAGGRFGSAVATRLAARQVPVALVDRDAARLRDVADRCGGTARVVVVGSIAAAADEIGRCQPQVVANFVGPFARNALPVIRAGGTGSHYLDLSNELLATQQTLALHGELAAAGRCAVTGAGFGVLGTEAIVRKLCENRPPAEKVRVDAIPSLPEAQLVSIIGPVLAASIVDSLAFGGRCYRKGKLVRAPFGSFTEDLKLPDGTTVKTGAASSGELEAARQASGAPFVVSASSVAVVRNALARAMMAAAPMILAIPVLRKRATDSLARRTAASLESGREGGTWAHASVEWRDGTRREGWLRAGTADEFTAAAAAEIAYRLWQNKGRPGAYTPASLFGPNLATDLGGEFLIS